MVMAVGAKVFAIVGQESVKCWDVMPQQQQQQARWRIGWLEMVQSGNKQGKKDRNGEKHAAKPRKRNNRSTNSYGSNVRGVLKQPGMIINVRKRKENKHADKPHDWKRGKRRETRKESASYVSRLFLILKVFWTCSSSPQLSVSHDVPAMLKDVMVLWKHPKQNACF